MKPTSIVIALLAFLCITQQHCCCDALQMLGGSRSSVSKPSPKNEQLQSRRHAMMTAFGIAVSTAGGVMLQTPQIASAAEPEGAVVLTEDEMAARVARKLELQRKARGGGGGMTSTAAPTADGIPSSAYTADIRSDVNPEAGVDLRSRSFLENTKIALEKQEELAKRDQKQKREDLCEMLGRGC